MCEVAMCCDGSSGRSGTVVAAVFPLPTCWRVAVPMGWLPGVCVVVNMMVVAE